MPLPFAASYVAVSTCDPPWGSTPRAIPPHPEHDLTLGSPKWSSETAEGWGWRSVAEGRIRWTTRGKGTESSLFRSTDEGNHRCEDVRSLTSLCFPRTTEPKSQNPFASYSVAASVLSAFSLTKGSSYFSTLSPAPNLARLSGRRQLVP